MTKQFVHSFTDDVLGTDDATSVAKNIKTGNITALAAAQASIARIQKVNPSLNALAHECFVEGELDAQRYNQGEFSGVPTVIKDNIDVKGLPTQQGTLAFKAKPAKKTEDVAKQFLAQGFTLLGKSTLPEFGFNGTTEYQNGSSTKNPWHTGYASGGSSGGSAALVASGAVPIAHGNDGGGSIRIPAALCGLVGLKPSRARMPLSNIAKQLPVNMLADGVLSRSVRDTANFMAAAEQYYHNPKFPPIGRVTTAGKKRLKIAVMNRTMTGENCDDATNAVFEKSIRLLESLGHDVVKKELAIPANFVDGFLNYYGFVGFATANFGKLVFGRGFDASKLETLSLDLKKYYQKNFMRTPKAVQLYWASQRIYQNFMQDVDVLFTPTTAFAAPKLGELSPTLPFDELMPRLTHFASFTAIHNVLGTPAISVPMGFTDDQAKRPIGMQFAAQAGQEKRLIELAFEIETAQPFTHIWQM